LDSHVHVSSKSLDVKYKEHDVNTYFMIKLALLNRTD